MATRIVVMKDGLIQQVDTPQNLYDYPVNLFVAGFIGTPQMNFITAKLIEEGTDLFVTFGTSKIKVPAEKANNPALKEYINQEVVIGIRPECLFDDPARVSSMPDSIIETTVEVTELMGAEIYLYLSFEGQEDATNGKNIIARVSSRSPSRAGDQIQIAVETSRMHIFDKDTERCIVH